MDAELQQFFIDADSLSHTVLGTTSPNPPVGALIVAASGQVIGRGATQPAGRAHAEVMALQDAASQGHEVAGSRAIVTLEPCNHTGRTGPCTQALLAAGIARVDFLFADPHEPAAGGAEALRQAGVEVRGPYVAAPGAEQPWARQWALEPWLRSVLLDRPYVVCKWAATADGYVAARDGSSQWITGEQAREMVHVDRSQRDAIIVGTGTLAADNPRLTARRSDGTDYPDQLQPLRVVVGESEIPHNAAVIGNGHYVHLATRSIPEVLRELQQRGVVNVLVEGGPRLTAAFFAAGVVDEVQLYHAPAILGGGKPPIDGDGGATMDSIARFTPRHVVPVGTDFRFTMTSPFPLKGSL